MTRSAILVTGAADRIGRAIAERFGAGGWHVVIHHRHHPAEAEALACRLPSAEVVSFELADRAGMARVIEELGARLADWRGLVCNACAFRPDWPQAPDHAVWHEVMEANLSGNVELARLFLDLCRANRRAENTVAGGRVMRTRRASKSASMAAPTGSKVTTHDCTTWAKTRPDTCTVRVRSTGAMSITPSSRSRLTRSKRFAKARHSSTDASRRPYETLHRSTAGDP